MTKACSRCGNERPTDDFYRAGRNRDRLQSWCKPCVHENRNQWRREHPDRERISHRRAYAKAKYGLTLEEYDAKVTGACAICGATDRQIHLDHDHATGQIRDALCGPCNQALGLFGDDARRLRAAADYLDAHRGV